MSAIDQLIQTVKNDLKERLPHQHKTQRDKLAVLVGAMLHIRSANLMELAAGLPRDVDRTDMRYQWIIRLLSNEHVICDDVMEPFARQVRRSRKLRTWSRLMISIGRSPWTSINR